MGVGDPSLLLVVLVSSLAGTGAGFLAGLVPGLHMNNLAALLSAYAGSCIGLFGTLAMAFGSSDAAVAVSSFLSAALIAHILSESVSSTYVGIPSGDVISVLPAHRLAKSGLGRSAVRASADGALAGVLASTLVLFPACLLMGEPVGFYGLLRQGMAAIVMFFSCVLLVSEGAVPVGPSQRHSRVTRVLRGAMMFTASGLLGGIVLKSNYYSFEMPDLPWLQNGFVPKDSLLLPMFAGLFGIPSLILSLGSARLTDFKIRGDCVHLHTPRAKDCVLSLLGGAIVGWMPGMTSGAAATLCAPTMRETVHRGDIASSLRFIWLYSSMSASGAVFALGALFTILRARSGTMDAVEMFLGRTLDNSAWPASGPLMLALAMSMLLSALVAHTVVRLLNERFRGVRDFMGSKVVALASLAFVVSLSVALTGARGALVMLAAISLGLLPPLIGVRRIQLMGCLLIPIAATLIGSM